MNNSVYFDSDELSRGTYFEFDGRFGNGSNKFELGEWLGRGGNGAAYRCQDWRTGEEYAVKFLLHMSRSNQTRFAREVDLLTNLNHEHIVRYRAAGFIAMRSFRNKERMGYRPKIPYLVMELAQGDLDRFMRTSSTPVAYENYAGQFRGLTHALSELHKLAIHRDIKPENILIAGDRWILSDYGLCTSVAPGEVDLTPAGQNVGPKFWPSPEAHNRRLGNGDVITKASDVFQLASVFWYVATGRHPCGILDRKDFPGPERLFALLRRALLHDGRDRPQNGEEFFTAINDTLTA